MQICQNKPLDKFNPFLLKSECLVQARGNTAYTYMYNIYLYKALLILETKERFFN